MNQMDNPATWQPPAWESPLKPLTPQPTGTEADVCADIARRQQFGRDKYGTTVAENPLPLVEWLNHAYQETLDNAIYLKRAIQILSQPPTETLLAEPPPSQNQPDQTQTHEETNQ